MAAASFYFKQDNIGLILKEKQRILHGWRDCDARIMRKWSESRLFEKWWLDRLHFNRRKQIYFR